MRSRLLNLKYLEIALIAVIALSTGDSLIIQTKTINSLEYAYGTNKVEKEIIQMQGLSKSSAQQSNTTYANVFSQNRTYKVGFVEPIFTFAAYQNNSFYTFYKKYHDTESGTYVTTDLGLLMNRKIPTGPYFLYDSKPGSKPLIQYRDYFVGLQENTKDIIPKISITNLTDIDVHFGRIFTPSGQNIYDVIFLFHSEYVTQSEYDNLRHFVANGGTIVFTESNVLYAEIKYNSQQSSITLVKGHNWQFDGGAARKITVAERWLNETRQWVGSNFLYGKPTFEKLYFANPLFDYLHSEEQYVTSKDAKILHNYRIYDPKDPTFDPAVATYEMGYGKGKVVMIGLYGHTLLTNQKIPKQAFQIFLKLFDYTILPHVLPSFKYTLVHQGSKITVYAVMKTGNNIPNIDFNKELGVAYINFTRPLTSQDKLIITLPHVLINGTDPVSQRQCSNSDYAVTTDHGTKLMGDIDFIRLDYETGLAIPLSSNTTTIHILSPC
jgi:hypothetical protein